MSGAASRWPAVQHLSFPVRDIGRSVAFYRDLLGFQELHAGRDIAELTMGHTKLVLLRATETVAAPTTSHFGFAESSRAEVDAWGSRARSAGATIDSGPAKTEWGGYVLYLRDPDGYLIEIWTDH